MCGHHRAHHSFPTRRSSDLAPLAARCLARATPCSTGFTTSRWLGFGTSSSSTRSEEHTSELQSPCNLVCRLLLEKKQQMIPCVIHNRHTVQYVLLLRMSPDT